MKRFLIAASLVALTASVADACHVRAGRVRHGVQTATTKVRTVTRSVASAPAKVVRETLAAPCANGKCPSPAAKK